ncbi:MAG: hypothetical protein NC041_01265 [Bacteroides sp.]|nr:hypothetical protein [Prevotella sp.]MCM1408105.1 hypothetical protein [Treponema brennaborense]MCM1469081.1 hypothetical protein [Bacteroides sp.]
MKHIVLIFTLSAAAVLAASAVLSSCASAPAAVPANSAKTASEKTRTAAASANKQTSAEFRGEQSDAAPVFPLVLDPLDSWNMVLLADKLTTLTKAFTGGRSSASAPDLILRLSAAGMLPEEMPQTPAVKVSRGDCIRFLWNLYVYDRDLSADERSPSHIFAAQNSENPVKDIKAGSELFDAVYGSKSRRIITLQKGYFFPEESMSAEEFKKWLSAAK